MAKPTNRVRVITSEESGCWAKDARADATAFPCARAGNIHPIPVVNPAMMIEMNPIKVELSIII